jgi:CRP-like cAMP-binding protein
VDTPFVISRTRQPQAAAQALRASDMFGGLSESELLALASLLTLRRVTRRSTVFHQGDEGISLFVVERGTIYCHMITDDGRELTVAVLGPGEILGELAFLDGHPRSATATALADSELWVLSREDFYNFVRRFPEAAPPVLAALSERFRRTYDELRKRSFASTEARLAQRLVDLARVHGRPAQQGVLIGARTTQGQLAELIGRSRVTVNKTLAQFEADGLIQRVGHRIVVRDIGGLKRLADAGALE